ncbi:MAG: TlpA family protein disulfide reductase [Acidimicrobiia bacterium]
MPIGYRSSRARRVVALLALSVMAVAACGNGGDNSPLSFAVSTMDGNKAGSLADNITGPTVVNLWATWCGPCKREMPDFETVHQQLGSKVRFIGLNEGDTGTSAAAFVADMGVTYDQLLDQEVNATAAFSVAGLPATVLIADGEVVAKHVGELSAAELTALIEDSLLKP